MPIILYKAVRGDKYYVAVAEEISRRIRFQGVAYYAAQMANSGVELPGDIYSGIDYRVATKHFARIARGEVQKIDRRECLISSNDPEIIVINSVAHWHKWNEKNLIVPTKERLPRE